MTNDATRATGEAMPAITRRLFLRRAAAAGAVAATVTAPAAVEAASQMSAVERRDYHLAEFQKAMKELDPRIVRWHALWNEDGNTSRNVFCAMAFIDERSDVFSTEGGAA